MTSNTFIKIKQPTKPTAQTQDLSQIDEQLEVEPAQSLEIEQPEQPEPTVPLESLAETAPDESVFGCSWSQYLSVKCAVAFKIVISNWHSLTLFYHSKQRVLK